MADPSVRFPDFRLPITAGMEIVWETQMQPRTPALLEQPEHAEALYCWWLIDGVRHHPFVPFVCDESHLRILRENVATPSGRTLPLWLYRYRQSSAPLQERFSLMTDDDVADFLIWAYASEATPAELLRELPLPAESLALLHEEASGCAFPLPHVLKSLWSCDIEGARRYDITDPAGCAALILWFLAYQEDILPLLPLNLDVSLADALIQCNEEGLPRLVEGALLVRPDGRQHFLSLPPAERPRFYYWISHEILGHLHADPLVHRVLSALIPVSLKTDSPVPHSDSQTVKQDASGITAYIRSWKAKASSEAFETTDTGGITIVGLAKGELGIGEDVRMAARACAAGAIPFDIYTPPFAIASRQQDMTVQDLLVDVPRYAVNLFFLPGMETLRLFLHSGMRLFKDHYTIGAWQWELPHWPEPLRRALPLAQEFWLSSHFTMNVMRRATDVPVFFMPMTVELPKFTPQGRAAHDLPEDAFLFLYVFDGLSWGARKNPMEAVKAFQDAFPVDNDVRLIIKTMNASEDLPFWREILKASATDPRILCINEIYTKAQVLSLFSCCGAYVSLHRAEGFGRTIAEAMLLEKPVIATAWSGNADFTTPETAFAVNGKLIPVREGEYLFWEGQEWCDPDHDEAVWAMRECVANPRLARSKAKAGRQLILEQYSANAVGLRYRQRLEVLGVL